MAVDLPSDAGLVRSGEMSALLEGLRGEARRLGFSRLGIAAVETGRDPQVHEAFRRWLDLGFAAGMERWLVAHEPLRREPASVLPGVRSVVMLATDYATTAPAAGGGGRVARYAWGDDYHDLLRPRLNALGAWLEAASPGARTRGVVDSAPFSEREFGWLAGLGWFGKNSMLINPEAGSYFFLSALLVDIDLPPEVPIRVDHCGNCTACLEACPTEAFVAPRLLDANCCISSLTIETRGPVAPGLRSGIGDWLFGCDICQEVCPWNRFAPGSGEPAFQPRQGQPALALAELLALDEAGFRRRFRGSPLGRAKRSGLLRSAALVLG
ncbi:MAG: tRNA epoxyqueuosine(34) reductase QueG, partial [Planctomycetota bacterium]